MAMFIKFERNDYIFIFIFLAKKLKMQKKHHKELTTSFCWNILLKIARVSESILFINI